MKKIKLGFIATLIVAFSLVLGMGFSMTKEKASADEIEYQDDTIYEDDEDDYSDEIDAYEQVKEEEEYIVDLVSNSTGRSLDTSDWKECLNYLRDNYESLINESSVDEEKVVSYVQAYTMVEDTENMPIEYVNEDPSEITRAPYNPKKVTAYTNKWWDSFNPEYPNFTSMGGDCANFVSQALHAGGKVMKGTDAKNFDNWFCRTNSTKQLNKVSSTWRGADAFGQYWMKNAVGYKEFSKAKYFKDKDSFKTVYNYASVGDAVSLLNANKRPYHTLVISYKNRKTEKNPNGNGSLDFAAHTSAHKWRSLYKYVNEFSVNSVRIYNMY